MEISQAKIVDKFNTTYSFRSYFWFSFVFWFSLHHTANAGTYGSFQAKGAVVSNLVLDLPNLRHLLATGGQAIFTPYHLKD